MTAIANNALSPKVRSLLNVSRLLALSKPGHTATAPSIRPLAIGEIFVRLTGRLLIKKHKNALTQIFPADQFSVAAPGGSASAVHCINNFLSAPNTFSIALDFKNAFNAIERSVILSDAYAEPLLKPFWRYIEFTYGQPATLLLADDSTILSSNGVRQGEPLSSILYCNSMRRITAFIETNKLQISPVLITDDVTLSASIDDLDDMSRTIDFINSLTSIGLCLVPPKCKVLWPHDSSPPPDLVQLANHFQMPIVTGFTKVGGGLVGNLNLPSTEHGTLRSFITSSLMSTSVINKLVTTIFDSRLNRIAALAIARHHLSPRLSYATRVIPLFKFPDLCELWDTKMSTVIQSLSPTATFPTNIPFSNLQDAETLSAFVPPSFSTSQIYLSLPTRLGGLGIPLLSFRAGPSFLASLAIAQQRISASYLPSPAATSSTQTTLTNPLSHSSLILSIYSAITPSGICFTSQIGIEPVVVLPTNANRFTSFFTNAPPQIPLEKFLVKQIQQKALDIIISWSISSPAISRALQLARKPHANSCLQIPPTRSLIPFAQSLSDAALATFISTKLASSLPGSDDHSICRCGMTPDKCGPYHSISGECRINCSSTLTLRHNALVRTLHSIATAAGAIAMIEPSFLPSPDISNKHADLYLTLPMATGPRAFLVDVSVTSATKKTITTPPMWAIQTRASAKMRKYKPIALAHKCIFVPVIFDVLGATDPHLDGLLKILADHAVLFCNIARNDFLNQAWFALATTLQEQNSLAHQRNTMLDLSSSSDPARLCKFLNEVQHLSQPVRPPPSWAHKFPPDSRVRVLHDDGHYYEGFVQPCGSLITLDDGDSFSFHEIEESEIEIANINDLIFSSYRLTLPDI